MLALIEVESSFKQFSLSHVGAQGLMQIMPFGRKAIGRPQDNLMDIETNLDYACNILTFYLKKKKKVILLTLYLDIMAAILNFITVKKVLRR